MLEDALKTHLLSKTQITDVVVDRVWYGDIPPEKDALPDVTFEIVRGKHAPTVNGDAIDLQTPIVAFTCRSLVEPTPCIELAALVRRSLLEFATGATVVTTYSGSVDVESCDILGEEDDQTLLKDGSEKVVYERMILARIGYRYSTAAVT